MRHLTNYRVGNRDSFESLFDDLERFFDGFSASKATQSRGNFNDAAPFAPDFEVAEDERGYLLSFDLPGVPKDAIQIEAQDQRLRVFGERKSLHEAGEGRRIASERRYGRFERSFVLPSDVDLDKIQAHHQDGVLHLMLPRAEKTKPKAIKIETGPTGFFSKLVDRKNGSDVQ